MDVLIKVNHAVLDDRLQLLLVDAERGLNLLESVEEVFADDLHLVDVVRQCRERTNLDVAVEGETGRTLDETADFGAREVLCHRCEFHQIDVGTHDTVLAHFGRVDGKDLDTSLLVRKRNLDVDFETSRTQKRLVNHVEPIRHSDEQNIVQLVDAVHLCIPVS